MKFIEKYKYKKFNYEQKLAFWQSKGYIAILFNVAQFPENKPTELDFAKYYQHYFKRDSLFTGIFGIKYNPFYKEHLNNE